MALRAASLFAGTGGLDLALKLAIPGAETVLYIERDSYSAATLVARMEDSCLDQAPVWDDIATFDGRSWRGIVDLVMGGIPCQPYSVAGKRLGNDDDRALWPEFARIVGECRPAVVFIENVPNFVLGGEFRPLGEELCRLGYEIEDPLFLAAEDFGACHRRSRVFVLAHTIGGELWQQQGRGRRPGGEDQAQPRITGADGGAPGAPRGMPQPRVDRAGNGMAGRMDRLRCCGNGVVALQAAVALRELLRRTSTDGT